MPKEGNTGLTRIYKALGYSMAGIQASWTHEAAFRQECIAILLMAPLALLLGNTNIERVLLIACCLLVLIVELLNSAIEAVVDQVTQEYTELAGRAKDMGSAAVFVSVLLVVFVWGSILGERLLGWLF